MEPSGIGAWKGHEILNKWFEMILDFSREQPEHMAYQCKCCWEQYEANTSPMELSGHALIHEMRGETPYTTKRPYPITGAYVMESQRLLNEHYETILPKAGTWKFQCRHCGRILPHRTAYIELMQHALTCFCKAESSSPL